MSRFPERLFEEKHYQHVIITFQSLIKVDVQQTMF